MHAAPERREIMRVILIRWLGTGTIQDLRRIRLGKNPRTLSGFMTCMATFGSGVKMSGMQITRACRLTAHRGRVTAQVPTCNVAARGAAILTTVALPTG